MISPPTGKFWVNDNVSRSVSTASIGDGLLYIADFEGIVHCLDSETGKEFWRHDTEGHIWGSTLLADGRVYIGNESGVLTILSAGREKNVIGQIDMKDPIYATPIVAEGAIYINTSTNLYAVGNGIATGAQ